MSTTSLIFFSGILGAIILLMLFTKCPRWAIAGLIIVRPVITFTLEYNLIFGFNFLKIYSVLFIILGIFYIIYYRIKILQSSVSLVWLIFLFLNFISVFIILDSVLLLDKIDYFLRILTGFIALILFAHLFDFEKEKILVLSIFIITGIVPILLWLITVVPGQPMLSNDELRRIIGPYPGFYHYNFYATQTIICCLAYLAVISKSRIETDHANKFNRKVCKILKKIQFPKFSLINVGLLFMIVVGIAMVYTCYSKAGWITLFVCFFLWFILRKQIWQTSLVTIAAAIIVFVNPFAADFQKTFRNEIDYFVDDSASKEEVFRGRLTRWETGMADFSKLPLSQILFGAEKLIGNPENLYFRVLWDNGIVGFIIYIVLLCLTGYLLISKYTKSKEPVVLAGILAYILYLLHSVGSNPMFKPNFQWFVWGMIGFVLLSRQHPKA